MTDKELLKRALERSSLFEGAGEELSWMVREFKRGETISETQNGVDCVGLILKGNAEVSPNYQSSVSVLTCGSEFGICNIFVRESMPTVLTAKCICRSAFVPKDDFAALLGKNSVLMYRYVRLCNQKMIYLADKLRLMSAQGCRERLAVWLVQNGINGEVRIKTSKDELARRLGISRASLFRSLSELEEAGIIRSSGDRIQILDPDADVFKN